MSYKQQGFINTHGSGGHDYITSGSGVPAAREYVSVFAWGGDAAITYTQTFPGGSTNAESVTITQSDIGVHSAEGLTSVAVTDGGTIIGYRKAK